MTTTNNMLTPDAPASTDGPGGGGMWRVAIEPMRAAEEVIDAINRVVAVDASPRDRITALLRDYQRLLRRDHDVHLILHDDLRHPLGPRIVERVTIGPFLERVEPRPDSEVQTVIDEAAPAVRLIIPDVLSNLREPRVFVISQDLPVTYRGWYEREIVDRHLRPHGWNDLMVAAWASGPDSMVGLTTYGRPDLPPFGVTERRLASLMLRAAAPMLYRELFDKVTDFGKADVPRPTADNPLAGHNLSERQKDVLILLLRGLSEKEVAADLRVSTHTVHTHVKRLYVEFGVSSRGELLALFVDRRVLEAAMTS